MNYNNFLELNDKGLYCSKGGFYIDPWRAVDKALITHAHSDHAKPGSKNYLAADKSGNLLRYRLGSKINLQTVKYGEIVNINGIKVSFHPAGHILGSAQIRLEFNNQVVVVSGDYKTDEDYTCQQFEPVRCNTFITESTFGLPVYKWSSQREIFNEINTWWKQNIKEGKTSFLLGYSLGKAQRLLSGLDPDIGPVLIHSSIENINNCYRESGIYLPGRTYSEKINDKNIFKEAIVIIPPSFNSSFLTEKIENVSIAFASGWMQVKRTRKWRSIDKGFVLSDHADWDGLINAVKETGAENIYVMHGYVSPFVRWLNENGWNAFPLKKEF